jgi:hypothetical protein
MDRKKQASILTDSHLKFLSGEREKPPSNPSKYRGRIRDRIEHGIVDMGYLFDYLSEEELRKVFGPNYAGPIQPHDSIQEGSRGEYGGIAPAAMPGALAFLVRGMSINDEPILPPFDEPQPAFEPFINALEYGISKYLSEKRGISADVSVRIELDNVERYD